MIKMMQLTALHLMEETNADVAYTQSDEISLVFLPKENADGFFGSRTQKLCSIIAAQCSVYFNSLIPSILPEKLGKLPVFDCRAWNVPNEMEAANTILWRRLDASKNSIQMVAQSMFSHASLQGLVWKELDEKLQKEKGVNIRSYPTAFRHGTLYHKIQIERKLTEQELQDLPEKHSARMNPDLIVKRSKIESFTDEQMRLMGHALNLPGLLFRNDPLQLP
jgi:tRNA(His) 5'-end guanylyltransferase